MGDVVAWLMEGDPAIRWQAMRDLADRPEAEWRAERAKVAQEGWGRRLLDARDADGLWAGGAYVPAGFTEEMWRAEGQPWTATSHALTDLRHMGMVPDSGAARRIVEDVGRTGRWDHAGQPFWEGEVEECINGRTLADGAYFGAPVGGIAERLLGEGQSDGGWNCERANGSVRSSFDSTINVLEGLLAWEAAVGATGRTRAARAEGEAFLLERGLFRRATTGEVADPDYLKLFYPWRWRHCVLRGLEYFRAASRRDGTPPDPRLGEAVEAVRAKRRADGTWAPDWQPRGRTWFAMDGGVGAPSRWLTLMALRVLRWWDGRAA